MPHAGDGTHTLTFAVEVDNRTLTDDDRLVNRLCDRFRAEVAQVIAAHRHQDELQAFLERCRFSLDDLRAKDNRQAVSAARQELMWHLRMAGWSYPKIGRLLHRDHSTIYAGVQRWEGRSAVERARERWQGAA